MRLLYQRHDHAIGGIPRSKTKSPTEDQIKQELANNLCRCGTHARIVRAVKRASAQI